LCTTANDRTETTQWIKSDHFGVLVDVRFHPESDHLLQRREMTLCAISDQKRNNNGPLFDHLIGNRKQS
jgi:hypothetical protein